MAAVEECLSGPDPAAALPALHAACAGRLSELSALVRGDLSGLARRGLAALITIDVHARGESWALQPAACSCCQLKEVSALLASAPRAAAHCAVQH